MRKYSAPAFSAAGSSAGQFMLPWPTSANWVRLVNAAMNSLRSISACRSRTSWGKGAMRKSLTWMSLQAPV